MHYQFKAVLECQPQTSLNCQIHFFLITNLILYPTSFPYGTKSDDLVWMKFFGFETKIGRKTKQKSKVVYEKLKTQSFCNECCLLYYNE